MLKKKQLIGFPILLILICIIFYPVIFQGKIFSSPDSLNPKAAAIILEKSQNETGEYPLWQPWIFSGMPTAESFTNTSNLYLPQYLFKLFHLPTILIHLLHFLFMGLGVYILLRYFKISRYVAIIGAAGFMLMPYLVTMEAFGHGSQAMTASYIPWALWSALRLFDNRRIQDVGLLALFLGFQLQRSHVQIAYYTWMMIGALFLFKLVLFIIDKDNRINAVKISALFILTVAIAFGLSALVYLPSIQYSAESIRSVGQSGSASYEYATSWSLHPKEMLTFLIPSAYGFGGQTYWGAMPFTDYPNYMGIIFLVLAIVAFVKNRSKIVWFFAVTTLLALLISFGSHFNVIYNLFYSYAPYFAKFRIPSMILILVQFNIIILAGFGLDKILANEWKEIPKWFWWLAGFVTLFVIVLLFGSNVLHNIVSGGFTQPRTQDTRIAEVINNLRWNLWYEDAWVFVVFLSVLMVSLYLLIKGKIDKKLFTVIIGISAVIDIGIVDYKIVQPQDNSGRTSQLVSKRAIERYFNQDAVTRFLSNNDEEFRVYPLGYLFGDSRLQAFGIESVGGYHPAKLAIYNQFLQKTNNISTLALMRMMNVHYILSPQEINHPELELVFTENMQTTSGKMPIWIYKINNYLPRAWFVEEVDVVRNEEEIYSRLMRESFNPSEIAYIEDEINEFKFIKGEIVISEYQPNYISIEVKLPDDGFLVISEVYYPLRWKAFVDGEYVETVKTNGVLRGLVIPEGEHLVEYKYDKSVFNKGMMISIISLIFAIGFLGIGLAINKK